MLFMNRRLERVFLDRSFVPLDKFIDILPAIYVVFLTINLNDARCYGRGWGGSDLCLIAEH